MIYGVEHLVGDMKGCRRIKDEIKGVKERGNVRVPALKVEGLNKNATRVTQMAETSISRKYLVIIFMG
jgi:hypothetical protein